MLMVSSASKPPPPPLPLHDHNESKVVNPKHRLSANRRSCNAILSTIMITLFTSTFLMVVAATPNMTWWMLLLNIVFIIVLWYILVLFSRRITAVQYACTTTESQRARAYSIGVTLLQISIFVFYLYVVLYAPQNNLCVSMNTVIQKIASVPCPWDKALSIQSLCTRAQYDLATTICLFPKLAQSPRLCLLPVSLFLNTSSATLLTTDDLNHLCDTMHLHNDTHTNATTTTTITPWMTSHLSDDGKAIHVMWSASTVSDPSSDYVVYLRQASIQCNLLSRSFCLVPGSLPPFLTPDSKYIINVRSTNVDELTSFLWTILFQFVSLVPYLIVWTQQQCRHRCCWRRSK